MLTKKEIKTRRNYIGGSDVPAILNLDYGCAYNLWLDKRGKKEDYPISSHHIDRGNALEPVIRKMVAKKIGYVIDQVPPKVSAEYPFIRGNIDGFIQRNEGEILEIKCPSLSVFSKIKREGISQSWIVQAQHYLSVWDLKRLVFAIFNAELWDLLTFDVSRDDELVASIIEAESHFWKLVQEGPAPDKLDENDKRCRKCVRRKACGRDAAEEFEQSDEIIDKSSDVELSALVAEYNNAKEVKEEAEMLMDDSKDRLKKFVSLGQKVRCLDTKLSWSQKTTTDTKRLFAEHPEIDKTKYSNIGEPFLLIK